MSIIAIPPIKQLTLRQPRVEAEIVGWLQALMNESKYVAPKIEVDNVFGADTAAELEEFLYRLGHPNPIPAIGVGDLRTIVEWDAGKGLPPEWAKRRLYRMLPEEQGGIGPFRKGWGITARSWEGLHPGEFPPENGKVVRPMSTPVSPGSWAYPDPEGQRGPDGVKRHYGIDWFGVEGGATPVVSPVAGKVERLSMSTNSAGQVFGGVISIRAADGLLFVFRHVNPRYFPLGQAVAAGSPIATVTRWIDGSDHTHHELYSAATVGNSRPYVGPPVALNPYAFYRDHGAI